MWPSLPSIGEAFFRGYCFLFVCLMGTGTLYPWNKISLLPSLLWPMATSSPHSPPMNLPILTTLYMWNYIENYFSFCVWLTSLRITSSKFIIQNFSYFLGWIIFHFKYITNFIHLFVWCWTPEFYFIANNTAINLDMLVSESLLLILLGKYWEVNCWIIWQLYASFLRNYQLFSTVVVALYISAGNAQGSLILNGPDNACYFLLVVVSRIAILVGMK